MGPFPTGSSPVSMAQLCPLFQNADIPGAPNSSLISPFPLAWSGDNVVLAGSEVSLSLAVCQVKPSLSTPASPLFIFKIPLSLRRSFEQIGADRH